MAADFCSRLVLAEPVTPLTRADAAKAAAWNVPPASETLTCGVALRIVNVAVDEAEA